MSRLDRRAILRERSHTELRGRTGKLYGMLDLATLQITVRRGGMREPLDTIDLVPILRAAGYLREDQDPPAISPL